MYWCLAHEQTPLSGIWQWLLLHSLYCCDAGGDGWITLTLTYRSTLLGKVNSTSSCIDMSRQRNSWKGLCSNWSIPLQIGKQNKTKNTTVFTRKSRCRRFFKSCIIWIVSGILLLLFFPTLLHSQTAPISWSPSPMWIWYQELLQLIKRKKSGLENALWHLMPSVVLLAPSWFLKNTQPDTMKKEMCQILPKLQITLG